MKKRFCKKIQWRLNEKDNSDDIRRIKVYDKKFKCWIRMKECYSGPTHFPSLYDFEVFENGKWRGASTNYSWKDEDEYYFVFGHYKKEE